MAEIESLDLVYISLMAKDVDRFHVFIAIYISSFENCLPGLLTGLFVFLVFDVFSSVHVLEKNPLPSIFYPFCRRSFHSVFCFGLGYFLL